MEEQVCNKQNRCG